MKSCTNCGALVAPENNICPNCGGMVSSVENNQGVNVAPAPSQVVQPASEPLSSIPVAPAPVPATEAVPPVAVVPEPVSIMPVVPEPNVPITPTTNPVPVAPIAPGPIAPVAPVAPTPVAVDENVTQPQAMPTVAPIPPAPQVVESTVVVEPIPLVAPTPQTELQPVQQEDANVAQPPTPALEVVPAVVPETISVIPITPTTNPVPPAPIAPGPIAPVAPAPEPISSVPVVEASVEAPVTLAPGLGSDVVATPTPEGEIKDNKKSKKNKKEPLSSEEKEKKFGRITTILILLISVISIAIISVFMYKIVKENEVCETNSGTMTTQYSYEGFDFFIPEGVIASVEDEEFVLRDKENTWSAVVTISDGSYNSLVSNKSQISSYFETLEYTSTIAEEKEVSGTSFVTTEVFMGSKNVLIAYAKASGTKIYGVVYQNKLGTYDNYSLNIVGEVLASAIYSGYDSAMPAGFTIDMFEQTFDVAK